MNNAPISFMTASIVNPNTLNGRSTSQIIGNRNSITTASGQHNTSRIHQSNIVFMPDALQKARQESRALIDVALSFSIVFAIRICTKGGRRWTMPCQEIHARWSGLGFVGLWDCRIVGL